MLTVKEYDQSIWCLRCLYFKLPNSSLLLKLLISSKCLGTDFTETKTFIYFSIHVVMKKNHRWTIPEIPKTVVLKNFVVFSAKTLVLEHLWVAAFSELLNSQSDAMKYVRNWGGQSSKKQLKSFLNTKIA